MSSLPPFSAHCVLSPNSQEASLSRDHYSKFTSLDKREPWLSKDLGGEKVTICGRALNSQCFYLLPVPLQVVQTKKTSRFPYIGSWCILLTVLAQNVMVAICFQSLFSNYVFKFAFIVLLFKFGSPSHLGHLLTWVAFLVCVGHIVWVILCG